MCCNSLSFVKFIYKYGSMEFIGKTRKVRTVSSIIIDSHKFSHPLINLHANDNFTVSNYKCTASHNKRSSV